MEESGFHNKYLISQNGRHSLISFASEQEHISLSAMHVMLSIQRNFRAHSSPPQSSQLSPISPPHSVAMAPLTYQPHALTLPPIPDDVLSLLLVFLFLHLPVLAHSNPLPSYLLFTKAPRAATFPLCSKPGSGQRLFGDTSLCPLFPATAK